MDAKAKLSDGDIKEVKKGRRAFLLAGLGATGLLAALTASACHRSDRCDADVVTDRVDPIRATRLFRQGATIIFTHLHQRLPSLGRLCEGLGRRFASRMQTNIYLTPPSAQGFAPHWDTHDVFILQVAGTKRWSIYDTKVPLPLRGQHFDRTLHEPGPVSMEFDLGPGDVCYIPRGAIHSAVSSTDTSLHITTGLIAYTWTDL